MNEGKKTLVFWAAAGVMLAIGTWVAWPTEQADSNPIAGNELFEKFTDPQNAASMKIVSFDEEQGQLDTFEVRRDGESGLWNIPSRDGYPADAIEQMRTAANALIGLKILDVQTSNAEDHDDLGVAEPKLEDLEVGDEGVGRLVTFKNESQETLASVIIGDSEKSDPEKRYVRIPGQDPVYVVKLDIASLSTNFGDWIESDLLKLSSIDISDMEIQDYTAAIAGRQLSLSRNYTANVELDGTDWKLLQLSEFESGNPLAEPMPVEVGEDEKLSKSKFDALKNALDDLKIVNVVRKPDGMSANLKADKDFLNDNEALLSLQKNGFFPASAGPDGEVEILSANGELSVTLKDGVRYVMRFGNISGVSGEEQDADQKEAGGDEQEGGVNRYLLVTALVDPSKFPLPDLKEVPKTVAELKGLLDPPKEEEAPEDEPSKQDEPESADESDSTEPSEEPADEPSDEPTEEPADEPSESDGAPEASEGEPAESETEGESESEGSGAASGTGEAQQGDDGGDEESAADDPTEETSADQTAEDSSDEPPSQDTDKAEEADKTQETDEAQETDKGEAAENEELTEEEWQERLEAEQEKITKDNQRKLDARKDNIEAAEKKVRELNGRFADWYYVIAEDTYAKLRIKREDLFEKPADQATPPTGVSPGAAGPRFNIPGLPGSVPGSPGN